VSYDEAKKFFAHLTRMLYVVAFFGGVCLFAATAPMWLLHGLLVAFVVVVVVALLWKATE
jgi:hypothetical protein